MDAGAVTAWTMLTLAINVPADHEAQAVIVVSFLAVGFMIWFLVGLLTDRGISDRNRSRAFIAGSANFVPKPRTRAVLRRIDLGERTCKTFFG